MKIENSSIKFDYLDSIRGIAALVVVIGHANDAFMIKTEYCKLESLISLLMKNSFFVGLEPVKVFFILSGFVLSYHFFNKFNLEYLIKQLVKRIPRLFIPVLITSILYWILNYFDLFYNKEVVNISNSDWYARLWVEKYDLISFFKRCVYDLMVFNDQSFCWNINSVLWTMPLELKYSYILFFSIFFIRNYISLIFYNFIIVIIIYYNKTLIDYLPFLLGINLSYLFIKMNINLNKYVSFLLIIIAYLFSKYFFISFELTIINQVFSILGAFFLLFTLIFYKNCHEILKNSFLVYLGKVSFSLYLIHNMIIGTISSYFYYYLYQYFHLNYSIVYTLTMIITLIISILTADLIYKLVDKQSLNFSNLTFSLFDKYVLNKIKNKSEFIK